MPGRDDAWGPWPDGAPGRRRRGSDPDLSGGATRWPSPALERRGEVRLAWSGGVVRRWLWGRARRVWRRRGVAAGSAHPGDGEPEMTACGSVDASRGCLAPPRARAPGGEDPRGSRLARRRQPRCGHGTMCWRLACAGHGRCRGSVVAAAGVLRYERNGGGRQLRWKSVPWSVEARRRSRPGWAAVSVV